MFSKDISTAVSIGGNKKRRDITLRSSNGNIIPLTYSVNRSTLTVKPNFNLDYDTRYELVVPSIAIWDMDKHRLKENFVLTFTTEKISLAISAIDNLVYEINQNEKYALPSKVKANMNDNSIKEVDVVWNTNIVDTAKTGTYNIEGTVAGYSRKVNLTLTVVEKKIEKRQKMGNYEMHQEARAY